MKKGGSFSQVYSDPFSIATLKHLKITKFSLKSEVQLRNKKHPSFTEFPNARRGKSSMWFGYVFLH